MQIKLAMYAMWVISGGLQLACAFLLFRRKLKTEYKYLLYYLLFSATQNVVLYFVLQLNNYRLYFYSYWVGNALADMCAFMVLHEIFCAAFKPFAGLRDMAEVVFRWATLAMLLVAFVVFSSSNLPTAQSISYAVINLQRSVRVMQCGLLLFMLMGSQYLGLSFKNRAFGLSLGFGLTASIELITWSVWSMLNLKQSASVMYVNNGSLVLALSIFFFYLLKKEPERGLVNIPLTSPLLRWNEAALAVGNGTLARRSAAFAEPFMPSVERMVDQVMGREMPIAGNGKSN
jgi:hypothetical protein